jgi:hypothetical protein
MEKISAVNEMMILSRDTRQSMRSIFEAHKICVTFPFFYPLNVIFFHCHHLKTSSVAIDNDANKQRKMLCILIPASTDVFVCTNVLFLAL